MKTKHSFTFLKKNLAVFLATFMLCFLIVGIVGIFYIAEHDFYNSTLSQVQKDTLSQMVSDKIFKVHNLYSFSEENSYEYFENTNFLFSIESSDGTLLFSNYNGEEILCEKSLDFLKPITEDGQYTEYTITGYAVSNDGEDIFAGGLRMVKLLYSMRYALIILEIFALIVFLSMIIYLFYTAGYHGKETEPRYGTLEKIPFDIFTLCYFMIASFVIMISSAFYFSSEIYRLLLISVDAIVIYLLVLSYLLSLTVRIKVGGLFKNMLIVRFFSWLFRKSVGFFRNLPFIWKTALSIFIVLFVDFVVLLIFSYYPEIIIYWFFKNLILVPLVLFIAVMLRRLEKGGKKIAGGDLSYHIDTSEMFGDFRAFGNSLNSISQGMSHAVDERMKSERMKTELITNVSHDIKTPLTSIINYVDLIKKEGTDNETLREYIAVLDRQSARLKKLIEDLVEASKASTGNLTLDMDECDIGVLLQQAVGEFDEKLSAKKLEAVVSCPEYPVKIMADGRYIWRVFDNLMSNICKYSLPGSRIYLMLQNENGKAIVTFKNISSTALNISPDELMERFVRGDNSRSTEGSGLGLSIAKSLTELQGGAFHIDIDGDLFKASLIFQTI